MTKRSNPKFPEDFKERLVLIEKWVPRLGISGTAVRYNKSNTTIRNHLKILKHLKVRDIVIKNNIEYAFALELTRLPKELINEGIIREALSPFSNKRKFHGIVSKVIAEGAPAKYIGDYDDRLDDANVISFCEALGNRLGTAVSIKQGDSRGGKMNTSYSFVFDVYSLESGSEYVDRLGSIGMPFPVDLITRYDANDKVHKGHLYIQFKNYREMLEGSEILTKMLAGG